MSYNIRYIEFDDNGQPINNVIQNYPGSSGIVLNQTGALYVKNAAGSLLSMFANGVWIDIQKVDDGK